MPPRRAGSATDTTVSVPIGQRPPSAERDSPAGENARRGALAVLRGALLDLPVTGDTVGTSAAVADIAGALE